MTLEFRKISKQFNRLTEQAVQRNKNIERVVPQVWQILQEHSQDRDLRDRARTVAKESRWRGAIPTDEALDLILDVPGQFPSRYTIFAGDGSQIYPDPHGAALYYLINVGTIIFRRGSQTAPKVDTNPVIYDETDMGFDEDEQSIPVPSAAEVDARRSLAEIHQLCEFALAETDAEPKLILMDGQMAMFANSSAMPRNLADELLRDYMRHLGDLRQARIPVAGFFSRRKSMMVTSLARLAASSKKADQEVTTAPPYLGVPDTAIFATKLKSGQRSAVFEIAAKWNIETYQEKGHSIHFFYINVGSNARPEIARVELPEWVAKDNSMLDLIHVAIVEQCTSSTCYPYVLSRAHEIAVVRDEERSTFEEMLLSRLSGEGIYLYPSGKAGAKDVLTSTTRN